MLKSNAPTQLTQIFAAGSGAGPTNVVPLTPSGSQPAGQIAYSTGFTTTNMTPIASGGVAPWGADFNGLFKDVTTARVWKDAGYVYPYSAAFATNANIGGYPAGAVLGGATSGFYGLWLSTADSNATNPDSGASAGWLELRANGGSSSIALSGASVTPTENQLGAPLLLLTGALTANCALLLPLRAGARWLVQNNTTGSFTVSVGGATGTQVTVAQGATNAQEVFTDGTNYYATTFNGAGVYLPIAGTAVAASKLATARTIAMTGPVAWSVSFDGSANVTAAATIAAGAVTLANLANLTGNTLLGNPAGTAAAPSAITLTNGLQFSGTALGMGAITPTSVTSTGIIYADYPSGSPGSTGGVAIGDLTGSSSARLTITAGGQPTSFVAVDAFTEELRIFGAYRGGSSNVYATCNLQTPNWIFSYPTSITTNTTTGLSIITTGSNIGLTIKDTTNIGGITLQSSNGSTAPNKSLRSNGSNGRLEILNSAFSNVIAYVDDSGNVSCAALACGVLAASSASTITTSGSTGTLTLTDTGGNGANLAFVGNGGTTPNKTIRAISGTLQVVNSAYSAVILTLSDAGNLNVAGTIQPGSDTRVKAERRVIENALSIVASHLTGYTYYRTDLKQRGAGFLAQRVREGLPHLVSVGPLNGFEDFHTMDYDGALAYVANAVTELHALVRVQQTELEMLRSRIRR